MKNKLAVRNKLSGKISSFSVTKENLHKLLMMLQERSHAAADLEISNFEKLNQSDEDFKKNKETIRAGFTLQPTIVSCDGKELYGNINDIFESPTFPKQIKSIYVNSEIPLTSVHKYYPANSFSLFLDFSKPDLLNLSLLPSQATPNQSNISVQGYDSTWTHGVFHEFNNFVEQHSAKVKWIHKHSIYDFLLFFIGLPLGFLITYKFSGVLINSFGDISSFLLNALYVYIFLISLTVFRLIFHYARWVFPLVEYKTPENKAIKHQLILGAIALSVFAAFIGDIFKIILSIY